MNRLFSFFAAIILLLASCDSAPVSSVRADYPWEFDSTSLSLVQYVDPMIGTDGHGHTFPGATAPFGMVQLSPDTRVDGSWDGCSGYHYSDSIIYGFSHTHLSGTGCSDYGDIMLMPGSGEMKFNSGADGKPGYRSAFSHANETAEAGYYAVKLNNGIDCEFTVSPRVGVHHYSFNGNANPWIILDMAHRDEVLECELEIVNDHTIRGKRFSKAWATNQQLWFYAEFSHPFKHTFWSNGKMFAGDTSTAKDLKAIFSFDSDEVFVKVGLSPVSSDNAGLNLEAETSGLSFSGVKQKVQQHWNSELSRIEIETDSLRKKRIFYTALYHCFIAPNVYCDVNGEYRGMDHKVYRDTVHQRYTVFSLWDTYRALHPLFTIIQQKRTNDFINTFLQQYKESGRLPVWELSSNETDCMIGYHSVSVIADAWMKGITGYDTALAYEAMKSSAMQDRLGLAQYKTCGFIPAEEEGESVSKTLEYAYDDWCIAQCAIRMNDNDDFHYFSRRANNWKNLFNPETGFLQARINNSFITPFAPAEVNFHYTEANAWQYSLAVQHDPLGLIRLHGPEQFEAHLDSLFSVSSKTSGREQADITGLIGQYAQGNEPSHHMAYLYSTIGKYWKTQRLVHDICNTLYTDQPDGLCGNEDCGQMSAWYVLSSSGFYPVTPGRAEFTIGSPQFKSVKYHLENGKVFTLNAAMGDGDYPYVWIGRDTIEYNHQPQSSLISFKEIIDGWTISLVKDKEPLTTVLPDRAFYLKTSILSTPWITGVSSRTFTDRMTFGMKTIDPSNDIYYSLNGEVWKKYSGPVTITENTVVSMYTFDRNHELGPTMSESGDTATAQFFKAPNWKSISIRNAFAPQYSAGGDRALIDGLTGTENFRTGLWQGYEGVDVDVVIDLGKSMLVESISINFLHDSKSWIFLPEQIGFSVSEEPETNEIMTNIRDSNYDALNETILISTEQMSTNKRGRYVRIFGINRKTCPPGHPGEGKPAWLFVDEITIKTK
jgi:predicted alpha-1,2-mannosidase